MYGPDFISIVIIGITAFVSYRGFNSITFFDKYKFNVDSIILAKDYKRLVTSGFLHVSWSHLLFNMFSLYMFSGAIASSLGIFNLLLIYFTSLVGGGLFTLLIHKNHGDYTAVGASGAVCGLIFASIALFPGSGIGIFFIPIPIPSWLFGLLFIGYTMFGIKSGGGNIGHEAHFGGALIGMIVAILLHPYALTENLLPILLILIPTVIFIYIVAAKPHFLVVDKPFRKEKDENLDIDMKWNKEKHEKQVMIDEILDKINKHGVDSLSSKEKKILEEYSGKN